MAFTDHVETNPDAWIGHHGPEKSYRPLMNEAKELIAAELHIPNVDGNNLSHPLARQSFVSTELPRIPERGANGADIVLVENASSGINAVLRSFPCVFSLKPMIFLLQMTISC